MTPAEALRLVEALPLTLATGQNLSRRLNATYRLKPGEAGWLVQDYQRFIALALSAKPEEATLPSPLIERVWQTHQDDPSYAAFVASLGAGKLTRHHTPRERGGNPAYKATRARYRAAFGDITPRWWPSPPWLWLAGNWGLLLIVLAALGLPLTIGLHWPPRNDLDHAASLLINCAVLVYALATLRKASPLARMTAPRASYAQASKAIPQETR